MLDAKVGVVDISNALYMPTTLRGQEEANEAWMEEKALLENMVNTLKNEAGAQRCRVIYVKDVGLHNGSSIYLSATDNLPPTDYATNLAFRWIRLAVCLRRLGWRVEDSVNSNGTSVVHVLKESGLGQSGLRIDVEL
ncbi:MAG: hypothetical protein NXY57DRAFT_1045094, partial [Lentinula lateritia]